MRNPHIYICFFESVVRPGAAPKEEYCKGANIVYADVCDEDSLKQVMTTGSDAVISCLASSAYTTHPTLYYLNLIFIIHSNQGLVSKMTLIR
jgi:putative NADH-flavin reductase